jgi:hypothetical protein
LRPLEFLQRLPPAVRTRVPSALASFHNATRFSLLQLWYGNRDIHFEAWVRSRERVLELGLHFEADPLTNARLLAAFQAHAPAIHKTLGDGVRIEEWDKGWSRVWEPVPLATLDADFLGRVAARLAAYIVALEPIVTRELPADVAWRETGQPARPARSAHRTPAGIRAKERR